MASINYKYRFREKLAELNREDYVIANEFLPSYLNISKHTWRKYKDVRANDGKDVPAEVIVKVALFFECSPAELYTIKPDYMGMVKAFNDLRSSKYPHYVFSRKFQD